MHCCSTVFECYQRWSAIAWLMIRMRLIYNFVYIGCVFWFIQWYQNILNHKWVFTVLWAERYIIYCVWHIVNGSFSLLTDFRISCIITNLSASILPWYRALHFLPFLTVGCSSVLEHSQVVECFLPDFGHSVPSLLDVYTCFPISDCFDQSSGTPLTIALWISVHPTLSKDRQPLWNIDPCCSQPYSVVRCHYSCIVGGSRHPAYRSCYLDLLTISAFLLWIS